MYVGVGEGGGVGGGATIYDESVMDGSGYRLLPPRPSSSVFLKLVVIVFTTKEDQATTDGLHSCSSLADNCSRHFVALTLLC